MKVHRSAFTPPPKVMSAIVHLVPATQPEDVDPALLSRLTEKGFGQRRKMLRQSLQGVAGAVDALEAIGIDPPRRAETVRGAEWGASARVLGGSAGGCAMPPVRRDPPFSQPPTAGPPRLAPATRLP